MQSRFHRWWLGRASPHCSWRRGPGLQRGRHRRLRGHLPDRGDLVGPEDEADIGLAAHEPELRATPAAAEPAPAPLVAVAAPADDDGSPRRRGTPPAAGITAAADTDLEADDGGTAAVVVESADPVDTAVVVEASDEADTTAVVDIVESDDAGQTEALIIEQDADEPEPSPA